MSRSVIIGLLVATVALATVGAMAASSSPDGLERVAEDLGFADHGEEAALGAPMPDYEVPGASSMVGTCVAGISGALVVGLVATGLGALLRRKKK